MVLAGNFQTVSLPAIKTFGSLPPTPPSKLSTTGRGIAIIFPRLRAHLIVTEIEYKPPPVNIRYIGGDRYSHIHHPTNNPPSTPKLNSPKGVPNAITLFTRSVIANTNQRYNFNTTDTNRRDFRTSFTYYLFSSDKPLTLKL